MTVTTPSEPPDKLDAPPCAAVVNGPVGEDLDWHAIDWRVVEDDVRRLRQRIFTASQAGDLKRVRNLQKLLLRSRANALLSVRRVTQRNAGRLTAGVDGQVIVAARDRARLAAWIQRQPWSWQALPVRRVFIPKAGGKRPLGIPVIVDRALQACVVNALEPEWEARFEPRSYGFRPGRGCQDAIATIYLTLKGANPRRRWALDADLASAFDRIDHSHLLGLLGTFPARGMIAQWLAAGVIDQGRFAPTEQGVPQGGVISPVLLNIALHGMEAAAGVRYRRVGVDGVDTMPGSPVLVRYADDLIALCHSRDQAHEVKAALAEWLTPRGLAFNDDKTRIVSVGDGFDFLGCNVRRYPNGKLLITPSVAAVRRLRARLRVEMRAARGANVGAVLRAINPIVRGWSAYYRTVVSSATFHQLDDYLWKLAYKWATHSHPNKPKRWIMSRYFGRFNPARNDQWVFGDRDSGAYLRKFSWTRIVRHQLVKGTSSPDDPALDHYWAQRRRKGPPPPIDGADLRLLKTQDGRCSLCGGFLLHADHEPQHPREWERWIAVTRKAMSKDHIVERAMPATSHEPRLVHAHCHRRHTIDDPALLPARDPSRLA